MALRQLLRRPLLATTFMRAGHGWERPDVPLSKPYVHRRRHKIEDLSFQWFDGVQPEYYLSDN